MSTQLAHKMIDGIIQRETSLFDVVYFYGNRELIGTLLEMVEEKYRKNHPHSRIIRTDAESFREETRQNVINGIHCMPECDLYILENIEEIAGLEINEQRLYGILDWLLENRRQIIISGASPTAAMENLAPRICAPIDGGISLGV